ncbi:unnamed protein product [Ceutorhynchus assimilis]|uniref:Gamma-glutamylcyclotransferase family protein n=1 Tax=Ceutorhynchus assimilis TaxID=467358 RepID=A0A9N9MJY2_9CUCU|nr:unnamed protein product [Ceutorhynchus assimilis]
MAPNILYKVFVYGTLKKGEPNYQQFSKSTEGYFKFLYHGKTKEKFPLIIGTQYNIPFLLHSPGKGHNVKGEIYEVDEKVLADLDLLEAHPDFYIRDEYDVVNLTNQTTEKVWIYMIKTFRKELLQQTFYESYSNFDSHGLKYVARYLKSDTCDPKSQIFPQNEEN